MVERHLIESHKGVREALHKLNDLAADAILFVVDAKRTLLGSLTDGDLRRGFLKGLDFSSPLLDYIQPNPIFIREGNINIEDIRTFRKKYLKVIPVVNEDGQVSSIINLRTQQTLLPLDAVIMAGGEGQRLRPLTEHTPKPLLKIGDKPIIEHNIDRLINYGVKNIYISLRYLGEKIESYFGNGESKGASFKYIWEDSPLGTLGAVCKVRDFSHDEVLVMNSDLLTNIDFEDFYTTFKTANADFAVASVPYHVKVPYAVLNVDGDKVLSFEEKPTYTYYSNAGIYLFKRTCIDLIPPDCSFNATDLIELLIKGGKKVVSFPILGYWLDIGKPEDFLKAQADIQHLNLSSFS